MAEETHGVGDRRRHGLGDNVRRKVRVRKAEIKQNLPKSIAAQAVFKAAAGIHAEATRLPKAPKASPPPPPPAQPGKGA